VVVGVDPTVEERTMIPETLAVAIPSRRPGHRRSGVGGALVVAGTLGLAGTLVAPELTVAAAVGAVG
jgi:hypothetical protein